MLGERLQDLPAHAKQYVAADGLLLSPIGSRMSLDAMNAGGIGRAGAAARRKVNPCPGAAWA